MSRHRHYQVSRHHRRAPDGDRTALVAASCLLLAAILWITILHLLFPLT